MSRYAQIFSKVSFSYMLILPILLLPICEYAHRALRNLDPRDSKIRLPRCEPCAPRVPKKDAPRVQKIVLKLLDSRAKVETYEGTSSVTETEMLNSVLARSGCTAKFNMEHC